MTGAPSTPRLDADAVHVWYKPTDAVAEERLRRYESLLDTGERARAKRFVFERDRKQFAIARGQLRLLLSGYEAVEPASWEFARDPGGRPVIAAPDTERPLEFNVSHCDGLVAVAVARRPEVGVDVENTEREVDCLEVARTAFTGAELRDLHALDGERRRERFFEIWTLKEAYVKARGSGLSLALNGFGFAVEAGGAPVIRFEPGFEDEPASWQFATRMVGTTHRLTVAVRRRGAAEAALRVEPSPV